MADRGWKRLARVIDEEREYLRLSWSALGRRSGLSARTIYDLRTGDREAYRPDTLDRLESAMWWEVGSVERVLAGRRPVRKADPDLARIQNAWRDLPLSVRRVLADVAELHRM